MPPLVFTPGQRSLMSGSDSMNAFANSLCSSMPVATARTFESNTMSSGAKPTSSTSRRYARSQIATFRSTLSACPCSSNAITTTPAPYCRTIRACSRNASSPSFSDSELTTPFPCRHLRPASMIDQRELSTMIGRRATSGSVATRFRNVVIAWTPSSRSASMLTSRRLAPPRTCSRATSSASCHSPASTSRRNRAEPVMFVRSPIITKFVSSVIAKGSSPLNRVTETGSGRTRGCTSSTAAAIARTWSGVVPQQPPTMLTRPSRANSPSIRLVSCGCSSCRPNSFGQAGVRVARDPRRRDARHVLHERSHLGRTERAVDADDQRLGVLDREPERLDRLPREVAAALVDRREREPERKLGRLVERRRDRGLRVQRVEHRLDEQDVDAAVAQAADLVRVCIADGVEGHRAIRRIVDARRERERHVQRADGAGDEPRPVRGLRSPRVRRAAGEPGALDVHLVHHVGAERVVGLADRRRGERVRRGDVGARGEVVVVDPGDDLGARDVQQVGVARDIVRMVTEALAAIGLLAAELALDEDAPGAVEHGDPLPEDPLETLTRVRQSVLPSSQPGSADPRSRAL